MWGLEKHLKERFLQIGAKLKNNAIASAAISIVSFIVLLYNFAGFWQPLEDVLNWCLNPDHFSWLLPGWVVSVLGLEFAANESELKRIEKLHAERLDSIKLYSDELTKHIKEYFDPLITEARETLQSSASVTDEIRLELKEWEKRKVLELAAPVADELEKLLAAAQEKISESMQPGGPRWYCTEQSPFGSEQPIHDCINTLRALMEQPNLHGNFVLDENPTGEQGADLYVKIDQSFADKNLERIKRARDLLREFKTFRTRELGRLARKLTKVH